MTCERGRINPDLSTRSRLFAASAGFCQNPKCLQTLFVDSEDSIHFAEMAHIIAASNDGPRAAGQVTSEERSKFSNLILLCANCHTLVDKDEKNYSVEMLTRWKVEHREKLERAFHIVRYENRDDARKEVEKLLIENRTIFETYGPQVEENINPESSLASIWKRKVRSRIIPNSRMLLLILDMNRTLLTAKEIETVEVFRQHLDDLESKHLNSSQTTGIRYPTQMGDILKGTYE